MHVPVPLRDEEVVVLDLSVEVFRRDVEIGVSSIEVEMHSERLVD